MRIVSVMTTQAYGGAEFAAVEMLDALIDRGHEAVLVTNDPALVRQTKVRAARVDLGPKLSTRTWRRLMVQWLAYIGRLVTALRGQTPYDVLMVHYKKEQFLAQCLPRRLRSTLVWAEWGPVPFPLRRGLPRRMFLSAAKRADVILAISEGTKRSLVDVGIPGSQIVVVPNAMRTEEIVRSDEGRARVRGELGIPAHAFCVGCISRLDEKKRNDVVIDATIELGGHAHLLMAGAGEREPQLRERAAPLGDRAHWIPTPGADVGEVLSAMDVLVFCPSPTEGQPRAVILGMLTERPCLSTGPEGVADMIDEGIGAIVAPENDASALAVSLARYVEDPDLGRRQGVEARRRALERYDATGVAERLEGLFLRAGAGGGR